MGLSILAIFTSILISEIAANRLNANCPARCTCSEKVVDCSNAGISTTEIFLSIPTHFPGLVALNMTGNKFEYLEKDLFNLQGRDELRYLEQLDLSNCSVVGVHADAFAGLRLEELILSRNSLSFVGRSLSTDDAPGSRIWPTENFLRPIASTLKILDLSDAFDRKERQDAKFLRNFTRLFNETDSKVLQYLNLSNNHLISLPSDIFCRAPNLEYLYLSSNRLHSFVPDDGCLPALMELQLRSNFFRRIDDPFIDFISSHSLLKSIDLAENPFTCDCESEKFIRWVRSSTKLVDKNRYVCTRAKPRSYANQALIAVPEDKLICSKDASEYLHGVYILCGLAFIGLIALLFCVVYTNRSILCKRTALGWMPLGGGYQSLGREPEVKAEMV